MSLDLKQDDDYFDDLPIAKWLNNAPIDNIKNFQHDTFYNAEIMSIASDLNNYNLNEGNTSNTTSIGSTTTNTDNDEFDEYSIEKLSISLQFWSNTKMKCYFKKWNNFTTNKLNIIHIKYKNYQHIYNKKILFYYFKKWQLLLQNYKSTIISLNFWANNSQSNYFKAWQKYTFETAPKSRIIFCNRIKKYLRFWSHQAQKTKDLDIKNKLFQLKAALIKWRFIQKWHDHRRQIKEIITHKNKHKLIANALKIWTKMFAKNRKLKQLKFRLTCKQFYVWWKLQSLLSVHYANTNNNRNYHSLDQQTRNVFAYWYTKKIHKLFKQWRNKRIYRQSLREKSFQCKQFRTNNTQKYYYKHWKMLFLTNTIIKKVTIKYYVIDWRKYKNKENIKRQNNLESDLCYSRNTLIKCYNFWTMVTKKCISNRLSRDKADFFYKTKISDKYNQILFGHWLLITIQQKDIKQKIQIKCRHNLLKRYLNGMVIEYEYIEIVKRFQLKWNKIKHFDVFLKIFIVWKKQCKYQIALLHKKREIERNKRKKIFHLWYLIVYKRRKLNKCQQIAKQCTVQSAFIRWKITMKHHLIRKRNEVYLTNKHKHVQIVDTFIYWRQYIQQKQNIKCHIISLNHVCDQFILNKNLKEWYDSSQLSLKLKFAKHNHIKNMLYKNIKCWLKYNRDRQKHKYMLHVAINEHNKTLLINAILYWNTFKCAKISIAVQHKLSKQYIERKYIKYWRHETMSNLSLQSRMLNFRTNINTNKKSAALKWWKTHHIKHRKLVGIETSIKIQRDIQMLSILFYIWFDKYHEKETLRLLNEYAIGLHKDKILTQIFANWVKILPVLKREKLQLMKPQLIFHFYQWRDRSAYNNDLRDRCYEMEVRKMRKYFHVYRQYVLCQKQQREQGQNILVNVHNLHSMCVSIESWREMTIKHKYDSNKYKTIRQKHGLNQMKSVFCEWKLLFELAAFVKNNKLTHCFKIWRQEYRYKQIEKRIKVNIYFYGIKKYMFEKWKDLLIGIVNQQKRLDLMVANRHKMQRLYFFAIWRIEFQANQLLIQSNLTNIRIRIEFWRNCTKNKIESRDNLSVLKNKLTEKWQFYPSSIYEYNYLDDDDEEKENENKTDLSPLKSISMNLAPILAKKYELNQLKYNRPTTPTLLSIRNNNNNFNYNQSKDDMFMDDMDKYKLIENDYFIKPTKKQIVKQILLKWKYFGSFKAFKRWKNILQIKKEENRLVQYAKYEYRQRSLKKGICIWTNTLRINKLRQSINNKIVRNMFNLWHGVYKYHILSRKYRQIAISHYNKLSKYQCMSYWNGLIVKRKICDSALRDISRNKQIHSVKRHFTDWQRLFLFVKQTRNDYNSADIYYYTLLLKNCFIKWQRLYTTKSIIDSLINNALIQHDINKQRKEEILLGKMKDLMVYNQFKQIKQSFNHWATYYHELQSKYNISSEIYTQNSLKRYFTVWKCKLLEVFRDLKLNEAVRFYESMRLENKMCDTLLYWKYITESRNNLIVKELNFYHSHLVPNVFISWKKYAENKRISTNFYYLKTMQKYMKGWKVFNKQRQKIYNNIKDNFQNVRLQIVAYQLNEWKCFALKSHQINQNAMLLIQKRDGIKFLSTNNLSSIAFETNGKFKIIQNDAKLLINQTFFRWKYFYDKNQKIKYFFRLLRLQRFVTEWIDFTKIQNRNKYLMSKLPIIAKNTSLKKHFNLWLKSFKYHVKIRQIHFKISNRQNFKLMKNTFLSFRDYICNEKRKHFIVKRLMLCKYIHFWLKMKQKQLRQKQIQLHDKYNYHITMKAFKHWKYALRDNLVSFHLYEFKIGYSQTYFLEIWRNINMKNKIKMFQNAKLSEKMIKCVAEWRGFINLKNKISEIQEIAVRYYTIRTFKSVWKIWQQNLCDRYILIDSRRILTLFHAKCLLNKWRFKNKSKQICQTAQNILYDYQRKQSLLHSFSDWNRVCVANKYYKISIMRSTFKQWTFIHDDILNEKYITNMRRQIFFVWYNYTKNCVQCDKEKINEIEAKQLLKYFKLWIKAKQLKQYLWRIYMNASKYYINNLMFKGLAAFKQHKNYKQAQRKQLQYAMILNEKRLKKKAMKIILFQWKYIKKGNEFYETYALKKKYNCFDVWYKKYNEIKIFQNKLEIGESHWRQTNLRIVVNDWLLLSHRCKQNKKYLMNAQNKYNRKLCNILFVFWYTLFKNVSAKKQKLYQLHLSWNKRKRNEIFSSWNNTFKANCHYKSHKKLHCIGLWKQLFLYHIAVRYERQKNINLCINVFNKWNKFTLLAKKQYINLDELYLIFIDWKKEKLLKEWRRIYYKHQKANRFYSIILQKKMFKTYIKCVELVQIDKDKDIKYADNYHISRSIKQSFYFWFKKFHAIIKKNNFLHNKCDKYLIQKKQKMLRLQFKFWLFSFHNQVNEKRDIEISGKYHQNYVLSKIFSEWKVYVKTMKYKSKIITKSLSALRQSALIKSGNNAFNKLSSSQSYIRLSNQSLKTFKNNDFNNYLKVKQNDEYKYNDFDDDDNNEEQYDSVLLKTPSVDSYYYDD